MRWYAQRSTVVLRIPVLQSGDLVLTLGAGDIGRTLREVFPVLDGSHKSPRT